MEKDPQFQMYATDIARNVPSEILKHLINLFMEEASLNMRNDFEDRDLERVIYFIKTEFNHLRIDLIASSFIRGSLGKFGAGRLIPRVVYGWLNEVSREYGIQEHHEQVKQSLGTYTQLADLVKLPLGKAINQKLDWYKVGLLDADKWDHVNLKELAEAIGQGHVPQFKDFYK